MRCIENLISQLELLAAYYIDIRAYVVVEVDKIGDKSAEKVQLPTAVLMCSQIYKLCSLCAPLQAV
jgi:hypothetical protein